MHAKEVGEGRSDSRSTSGPGIDPRMIIQGSEPRKILIRLEVGVGE